MNPHTFWRRLAWVVALAAALVSGADTPTPLRPSNVVVVTLDTTRADRLPAYGYGGGSMPALDRLAREGVVFERAMSVAPLTLTAHCSLFTGLYPPHHHVRDNADPPLEGAQVTLADVLHRRGFRTAAFVGTAILAASRGLARGFEVYGDGAAGEPPMAPPRRSADEVVSAALNWLAAGDDSPFLLWVHLYDAHAPYAPPEPYRSQYGPDLYEGAIAFAESQLARLLSALEARHLVERTAILVVGDHGESLGEHGEIEHGLFVYESALRVPMILRSPGVAPQRFGPLTSLVDVMPTVLDLLGMGPVVGDGLSLLPAIQGAAWVPDRQVYAESWYPRRFRWSPLRALRDGRFKLIEAPRPELYDVEADPFELHNLYGVRPALAAALTRRLAALDRAPSPVNGDRAEERVAADVKARLASLGYVAGRVRADGSGERDPKDYIDVYNEIRANESMRLGRLRGE